MRVLQYFRVFTTVSLLRLVILKALKFYTAASYARASTSFLSFLVEKQQNICSYIKTAVVEKDAKRTAKEVAKKVEKAYQYRGWLP